MKKLVTQERLKELLHYDPLTGVFIRLVDVGNRVKAGQIINRKDSYGYSVVGVDGKRYLAHRLAWLYVYGYLPENDIDHIDRVRHHNWISNLREVSRACNQRNTGNPKDNTSGTKGVVWNKAVGKWQASVMVNGKQVYLGQHTNFTEAACHRLAAEQAEDWAGCDSSSPAYIFVRDNIQGGK
jgi:hypothetical protein